ncbi:MAG: hypothetical protein O3A57_04465 [Bacteroidetes bacterium]|nr:hypothetical protein [Bacteroidota bacterium]
MREGKGLHLRGAMRLMVIVGSLASLLAFFSLDRKGEPEEVSVSTVAQSVADVEVDASALVVENGVRMLGNQPFSGLQVVMELDGSITRIPFIGGRKDGIERSVGPDGSLRHQREWAKGLRQGVFRAWWPDGTLKTEQTYRNDLLDGGLSEWFADGTPARRFSYNAGKEEGPQKMWFEDGSIRANYVVRDGRRYGSIGTKGCE